MSYFGVIGNSLKHAWNAFRNRGHPDYRGIGAGYSYRPDRRRLHYGAERSIVNTICNRLSVDAASVNIYHVRTDENGRFTEIVDSSFNRRLTVEVNKDQSGRSFRQDVFMSMLDEGCVAIIPVDTSIDPNSSETWSVDSFRTAKIIDWYPDHIRVKIYNDTRGIDEEVVVKKSVACIVENPFYSIMNEPNSTMQRLTRKLAMLDSVDEQSSSGKLDLIVQLPYAVKSEMRKNQAEERRTMIEKQLAGSKYGIAYIDATEKVIQLNRSLENNLLEQIKYLTDTLFSQLGLTPEILNGTADEQTMINYNTRIIEPIVSAFTDELKRKYLTSRAIVMGQSFMAINDPFRLVPVSKLADMADKFTRNAILSSNEIRASMGFKPSDDPRADELRNKNLNATEEELEDPIMTDDGREDRG